MHYVVTGGNGFIGSHLVDRLLHEGHTVHVIDNLWRGNPKVFDNHPQKENLEIDQCRVDKTHLSTILRNSNIDAVFHLAAIPMVQHSIDNPDMSFEANLEATYFVLEACRNADVKRLVFASSSAVYGKPETAAYYESLWPQPKSPYGVHKWQSEISLRNYHELYGLETVALRYFNVYGPRQNPSGGYAALIPKFIRHIKAEEDLPINGDGEQTRDFIYVNDVVEANMRAAKTKNKACYGENINIGSGKTNSVNDVTQHLLEISGSKVKAVHGPPVIEPKHTLADISKAKNLLNWEPTVSFKEGLQITYDSCK